MLTHSQILDFIIIIEKVGGGEKAAGIRGANDGEGDSGGRLKGNAVNEVFVGVMFKVLGTMGELTAGGVFEQDFRLVAESFFGVESLCRER